VNVSELLVETFDRMPDLVRAAVSGLTAEQLRWAPAPGANTVGWLVWHLTRNEDSHVAELIDERQVWLDWAERFAMDPDPSNTGYGHTAEQVASVQPESTKILLDYYAAVSSRTREYLVGLTEKDLDQIVDRNWNPPVTLGVRLVSIANDDLEHVGQAAYVRGLVQHS
jgi:hypothetical protein